MSKKYSYDVKNKKVVEQEIEEIELAISASEEIRFLKEKLANTDYQAIKYAEGHISDEEYTSIKVQRQAWRDRINELELELEVTS